MVTNFSRNSYKNILLQTVNAEVVNLDNRNCEKCDSGAQRTYITKSLKDKLKIGTPDSKIQETEIIKIKRKGINKNLFVEALVIPNICFPFTNRGSMNVLLSKYPHLRNLGLAQKSIQSLLNIDVLIG